MNAAAEIGSRVAWSLRQIRPKDTAKIVARETGAAVPTVKGWLAGKPPGLEHLGVLCRLYGSRFAAFVTEPINGAERPAVTDLAAEIAELRTGLALVEAKLKGERH